MADPATTDQPSARPPLILASASPRRRILLAMLQIPAEIIATELDEEAIAAGLDPMEAVVVLAKAKAAAVPAHHPLVLAADTVVSLDGEVLAKPADRAEAAAMLRQQSGRQVQVVSCVALRGPGGTTDDRVAISTLQVAPLDEGRIDAYLATGEADDKAGALAVQGSAGAFTTLVDGSRSNVVGLPLAETVELLRNAGMVVQEPGRETL